jgi:hypothetical protein
MYIRGLASPNPTNYLHDRRDGDATTNQSTLPLASRRRPHPHGEEQYALPGRWPASRVVKRGVSIVTCWVDGCHQPITARVTDRSKPEQRDLERVLKFPVPSVLEIPHQIKKNPLSGKNHILKAGKKLFFLLFMLMKMRCTDRNRSAAFSPLHRENTNNQSHCVLLLVLACPFSCKAFV